MNEPIIEPCSQTLPFWRSFFNTGRLPPSSLISMWIINYQGNFTRLNLPTLVSVWPECEANQHAQWFLPLAQCTCLRFHHLGQSTSRLGTLPSTLCSLHISHQSLFYGLSLRVYVRHRVRTHIWQWVDHYRSLVYQTWVLTKDLFFSHY